MSILKKLLKRGDCKAMRIITRTGIDNCGTLGNAKECTAELRSPLGLLSTRTAENGRFTAFLTVNQRGVGGCLRHVRVFLRPEDVVVEEAVAVVCRLLRNFGSTDAAVSYERGNTVERARG